MLNNNLQLYRNDVYFNDKETAKVALESQLKASSDGELVISRYAVKDENNIVVDVKTLFGFAANGNNGVFATIYDYEDFFTNSKLKELKVNDVLANWDETNTSLSVVVSASDINTPSGYTTISYSGIGEDTFESIKAYEPMDSALSKIESNIDKLIRVIVDNEYVIASSLTKFNESAGFNDGEYSADENDVYLSGATSLKNADILLSEAIESVESELQSQSDRITQLKNNPSISGSNTITIEDVVDDNDNVIGKKASIVEGINISCGTY